MSPRDRQEFDNMKATLLKLEQVLDTPFIENIKRRAVNPRFADLGLEGVVSKTGDGNTSGVLQSVDESGSGTYSVAAAFNGTLTVRDTDGTSYKLGYYTP